jgi:membrane-bound ClpP family serine protease
MTACLGVSAVLLGMAVVRARFRKTRTGKAGMVGQIGVARTKLDPDGMVLVFGELWAATAEGPPIEDGENVYVLAVSGLSLRVRRATVEEMIALTDVGDRRAVVPVR